MPLFTGTTAAQRPRSPLMAAMRHSDALLALFLVGIVALFMLPLPPAALDLLIAANLSISVALLIVSMYVGSALSLSTFPSLLLFTTLFRLALNIASAKLILLHAHAGQIIDAFGKLIVGNNVVVGGVVFLIVAIVQFIVIAKGSERVAEVGARFALDAMPGKQMSIDAEVRAGNLSNAQAQARRSQLEQESQLHGAMDGAMKFVKGDAIASLVVAAVNILGGVAVGTLMHDMDIGHAVQRYAILTVGDGMVSQIPSLLVSIAAGIVITRCGGGGTDSLSQPLAAQMLGQFANHPRALFISGLAVASFMFAPGFPAWAFVVWLVLLFGLAWAARRHRQRGDTPEWIFHDDADSGASGVVAGGALTFPVALRLAPDLHALIDPAQLDRLLIDTRRRVEAELGPVFPRIQISASAAVPQGQVAVLVQDVVQATQLIDPQATGGPEAPLAALVERVARQHLPALIGLQEVRQLIHGMQAQAPELAVEVTRVVPVQKIAETLRRLLTENIPVRNLKAIFESLVRWAPREEDSIALTELVRADLGPYITSLHATPQREIHAVLFDTQLIDRIEASIERTALGNRLLLDPAVKQAIFDQLRSLVDGAPATTVVVVSSAVRRYVRNLVAPALPKLPVLSYQEVDDDITLQPVGWVTGTEAAHGA
ncbi:MAG TPA: FHIPEP family type III secretion protein [Ideonella sp.]|uniref:FHIPEP family type III secretion protein n=1 Tax=Ideonella sp. TaxID=1929293 RepID=UPI002E3806DA|nr:FHIPEP family type III secretion protein [Ideonella sp.]HEX5687944.1 FHIPEP family type III secretion protein [Ideonella sp.]